MTKIVPEEKPSTRASLDIQDETDSNAELFTKPANANRNFLLKFILSIRLFLIVAIVLIVLMTAIPIWSAAYTMNEAAALQQVDVLITNMNEKIQAFMNGQLIPAKYIADCLADDYHNNHIDFDDTVLSYLFQRIKTFGVTLTNFCLGEQGHNALYAFSADYRAKTLVLALKRQKSNFVVYQANMTTGEWYPNIYTTNITYAVGKTDYYMESMELMKNYPNGAFGAPYKVINGPQSTYWSTPIYNRTELPGKKTRIGFAKINISLDDIAKFLSAIKVLDKGYVILSEYGNDYVIGSSLTIDEISLKRVKATNVTTRGAGTIMTKLLKYQTDNNLNQTDSVRLTLTNDAGESFLVSSSPYIFHNLKWRMTLVFDEREVKEGIIMSSYVIIGVALGVCVLGVIMSVLIGWSVASPFIKLQQDFKKIEILDLANIKPRSSIFTEANSIYASLSETVRWLVEIRAFIPDSVLNQLEMTKFEKEGTQENNHDTQESFHSRKESKSHMSEGSIGNHSKISKKENIATNLFKLGLSMKECAIIYLTVPNLNEDSYEFESGLLSNLISKALTSISTICKTSKADLQIKSYNEYVITFTDKNPQSSALETSLKILTLLNSLNETLAKDSHPKIKMCVSIASGNGIMGNVGSKQMRYFAMIGSVMNRAKELNEFSNFLEIPIICDWTTYKCAKQSFIFRPVERTIGENHHIHTVYQLLKRSQVQDDEWLYELEQKKANSKFDEFNTDFLKIFESENSLPQEEIDSILSHLSTHKITDVEDKVIERLEHLLAKSKSQHGGEKSLNFLNYHTVVGTHFTSYLKPGEPIFNL